MSLGPPALVAFLVALAGTGLARHLALRSRVIAEVTERSSHARPTPSGGGLAIAAGVVAGLVTGVAVGACPADGSLLRTLGALLLAAGIGWRDDVRDLPPRLKAVLLLVAAALLAARPIATAHVPYVGDVDLGLLALPLTLFWLWGFANLFNFMDGIDGIAGLTAAISATAYAVIGWRAGDPFVTALAIVVAAAACGFLPWNFPRARIFMGDAGSLPLGLLLAFLAVVAPLPFAASMMLLGPFVFDTTFTLIRRAARGARLSEAHREHLYQRLSRRLRGHPPATLAFAGFSVVTAVLAVGYEARGDLGRALSLVVPLAAMLLFAAWVIRTDGRPDPGGPTPGAADRS